MARYAKFFSVGSGGGGTNNLQLPIGTVLDATLRQVQDGTGTGSPLYLSINRVGITSDPTVTIQTSSVIQATTTNANLVIAPNGTGALIADIPDGTATGGNARGTNAVDLQTSRGASTQVASGNNSVVCGGANNSALGVGDFVGGGANNLTSSNSDNYKTIVGGFNNSITSGSGHSFIGGGFANNINIGSGTGGGTIAGGRDNSVTSIYSTVSGGQSNTASTGTYATVVGGLSNTASGTTSISGGQSNTASAIRSVALGGFSNTSNLDYAVTLGGLACQATNVYTVSLGNRSLSYLAGQFSVSGGNFTNTQGQSQQSNLTPLREATLTTGGTTTLSLDGTGTTNLIIPNGTNRMWNVQIDTIAVITTITGTATGVVVGDAYRETKQLLFKRVGGTSSIVGTVDTTAVKNNTSMATASLGVTAGASQEMALTFTAPTFSGGGSLTCRVVSKVQLVEVAY